MNSGNGLVPNRRQAITRIKGDRDHSLIYASLGLSVLNYWLTNWTSIFTSFVNVKRRLMVVSARNFRPQHDALHLPLENALR